MKQVIQHFGKGETIIAEGRTGDRVYRLLSGEALVCKRNMYGKNIPVARLQEGDMFGEMYLFDTGKRRSATVIAVNDLRVEVFFEGEIRNELDTLAPEMQSVLKSLSRRISTMTGNFAGLVREKMIAELPNGSIRVMDYR